MASQRGAYRAVHSVLIDSPDFQELSDNAKLVFYTIRFCQENNIASIFSPFYPEILTQRLKMDIDAVDIAFRQLIDRQWIVYEKPILWIRNGLKYSPGVSLDNEKHMTGVENVVAGLPKLEIVKEFCTYYNLPYPFDSQSIEDRSSNRNRNREEEKKEDYRQEFENEFWPEWPKERRVNKKDALKQYIAARMEGHSQSPIMFGLKEQKKSEAWKDPKYIPHPHRWLRNHRWTDEIDKGPLDRERKAESKPREPELSDAERQRALDDIKKTRKKLGPT